LDEFPPNSEIGSTLRDDNYVSAFFGDLCVYIPQHITEGGSMNCEILRIVQYCTFKEVF